MPLISIYFSVFLFFLNSSGIRGDKSDTWPPSIIYDIYNVTALQMTCDMETGINRDLIREFETTRDLEHLPDTRQLRCYFYCVLKYIGFMVDNSVETHPEVFIPIAEQLNPKEIRQYINMNRKCSSKLQEPCDKAYALNKCWKLNSPEFYYIF